MTSLFENCLSLTSVDIQNFNGRKIRRIDNIFYSCPNLTYIDISGISMQTVTGSATFYVFNNIIPSSGQIKIKKKLADFIYEQIPSNWTKIIIDY